MSFDHYTGTSTTTEGESGKYLVLDNKSTLPKPTSYSRQKLEEEIKKLNSQIAR